MAEAPDAIPAIDADAMRLELERRAEEVARQVKALEDAKRVSRRLFEGFVVVI